jgi:flagellar biosynthesis/type III secretory pathway protein FliH
VWLKLKERASSRERRKKGGREERKNRGRKEGKKEGRREGNIKKEEREEYSLCLLAWTQYNCSYFSFGSWLCLYDLFGL